MRVVLQFQPSTERVLSLRVSHENEAYVIFAHRCNFFLIWKSTAATAAIDFFLQSLVDVEHRWKDIDIDMSEYKDKYYKIRGTEDLFQVSVDAGILFFVVGRIDAHMNPI